MRSWQALRSAREPVCMHVARGSRFAGRIRTPTPTSLFQFSEVSVATRVGVKGKLPVT